MTLADLFGYVAAVILTLMSIPQTITVLRRGAAGVSLATWWALLLAISLWLTYGIDKHSTVLVIANVAGLLSAAATVIVIRRAVGAATGSAAWFAAGLPVLAVVAAVVGVTLALPIEVVALAAVVITIASRVPQALTCIQAYRKATPTSVSHATWTMSAVGQSCWIVNGVLSGDVAITVVNAVCVALTVVLLVVDTANIRQLGRQTKTGHPDSLRLPVAKALLAE